MPESGWKCEAVQVLWTAPFLPPRPPGCRRGPGGGKPIVYALPRQDRWRRFLCTGALPGAVRSRLTWESITIVMTAAMLEATAERRKHVNEKCLRLNTLSNTNGKDECQDRKL